MKKLVALLSAFVLIFMAFASTFMVASAEPTAVQTTVKPIRGMYDFDVANLSTFSALPTESALITAVVDGDTLVALFSDGIERQIRLLGIDTPEVTTNEGVEHCFGSEASAATSLALKASRYVYLQADPTNRDEDDFGRKLRTVYVQTEQGNYVDLSELLIAHGFGWVYRDFPNMKKMTYLKRELKAREEGHGLWNAC